VFKFSGFVSSEDPYNDRRPHGERDSAEEARPFKHCYVTLTARFRFPFHSCPLCPFLRQLLISL
jgi:hypothetical protein